MIRQRGGPAQLLVGRDDASPECPRHYTIRGVLSCIRCAGRLHSQLDRRRELDEAARREGPGAAPPAGPPSAGGAS